MYVLVAVWNAFPKCIYILQRHSSHYSHIILVFSLSISRKPTVDIHNLLAKLGKSMGFHECIERTILIDYLVRTRDDRRAKNTDKNKRTFICTIHQINVL